VWNDNPVTAQQLDIGTFGIGSEYALRTALETVELAGYQRFQRKLVVLELRNFDLETLFLRKIARRYHQKNSGVCFRVDQSMLPDLFLRNTGRTQTGQCRSGRDGCKRNLAGFHASSSLVARLDGVYVAQFLRNSSIIWTGGATAIDCSRMG